MPDRPSPARILVAGDWHGNTAWAVHVIKLAAEVLDGEPAKTIVHLGDFGIWPGPPGWKYMAALTEATGAHGVEVCFVDGNHEDHDFLDIVREGKRQPDGSLHPPFSIAPDIWWLPRGYRWTWHGRTWLALGGGVSLDRAIRTEGKSWWPQEEITAEQAAQVIVDGGADVMVTHDCPSGVRHTFPPPPSFWDPRDLARNDVHRQQLQLVVNAVQPKHLMHGHLHRSYQRTCDFGYGPVSVTGLDCDGGDGANWAVLDTRTMTWSSGDA
jgi:Calcineurin-like phosphoesterase